MLPITQSFLKSFCRFVLEQARGTMGGRSPHQWGLPQCGWRNPAEAFTSCVNAGARTKPAFHPHLWNYICSFSPKPGSQTVPSWSWERNTPPQTCVQRARAWQSKRLACALSGPVLWQSSKSLDDTFTAACSASCLPVYHLHSSSSANWDQLLQFQILLSRNIDTTTLWLEGTLPNASQFCTAQAKSSCRKKGQFPERTE